jgi:hypothetical protein
MAIKIDDLTDGSTAVTLDTTDDREGFFLENAEAIVERYGSKEKAYRHLCDGGLILGGGASPEVAVYFDA